MKILLISVLIILYFPVKHQWQNQETLAKEPNKFVSRCFIPCTRSKVGMFSTKTHFVPNRRTHNSPKPNLHPFPSLITLKLTNLTGWFQKKNLSKLDEHWSNSAALIMLVYNLASIMFHNLILRVFRLLLMVVQVWAVTPSPRVAPDATRVRSAAPRVRPATPPSVTLTEPRCTCKASTTCTVRAWAAWRVRTSTTSPSAPTHPSATTSTTTTTVCRRTPPRGRGLLDSEGWGSDGLHYCDSTND